MHLHFISDFDTILNLIEKLALGKIIKNNIQARQGGKFFKNQKLLAQDYPIEK